MNIYFLTFISVRWWAQVDSNHRPRAYQARALTTWAMSPWSFRCISFSLHPCFCLASPSRYLFALALSKLGCPAFRTGGDDGNRTHDPLLAGQVLSQLSYTPILLGFEFSVRKRSLKIEQQWDRHSHTLILISRLSFWFLLYKTTMSQHSVPDITVSIERRWSSRTFRYGYLVTT